MDTNEKIHIELLKRLKIFSENYFSDINENFNDSKKHYQYKITKRHKRRLSPDIKKMKNMINSPKKNHRYNSTISTNNFNGKNKINKNGSCKQKDEPIKSNLVSRKFKIANDFNEENSNQFLNEKDECLKKIILSEEIEEEKVIHFYSNKEKIFNLSTIKKNKNTNNLYNKHIKRKIIKYDSDASLSKLIGEIK